MSERIGGRCIRFGDGVNTDVIIPGRYLVSIDPTELAEHAFEPLGPEVQRRLRTARVVVAGRNFGCGSAREQAASCLVGAGIVAVVAASFSRVFFRNAINTGLLAVECAEAAAAARDGDDVRVDVEGGFVEVGGERFAFPAYPESLRRILLAGGLIPYLKQSPPPHPRKSAPPGTPSGARRVEPRDFPGTPGPGRGRPASPARGEGPRGEGAQAKGSGRTFAEKVLGGGAGEVLDVYPDLVMSHSASWRCIRALERLGRDDLYDPDRIAMVMDHISPARTSKTAADQRLCREFAARRGIRRFHDVEAGIAHTVLMELGDIRPGQVVIGTDSHSTIYGALGAFGTGVGFSEVTATWVTGSLWMRVPASLRVEIDGTMPGGVTAKDLMLRLIGELTADGATYLSVEFHGGHVRGLSVSERMTLCNLAMELGAKNAYVPPDDVTRAYLAERGVGPDGYREVHPGPDAAYDRVVHLDASSLEPMVSCPHTVDTVRPLREVAGSRVDQVFIGSCANAKYDDLAEAAAVLRGRRIAPGVRLIVTPASREVVRRTVQDGVYSVLLDAGALITNPGCGACAGDGGVLADGEVCFSTANRNFQGRMGSYDAEIYLGSPAAAAATAVTGVITDPRTLGSPGR